ncbi:MAG: type II secretion system F family protein [Austwickia sp.]|nr:type II secretion system F family protein [Austwickia sp.]MBK8437798.1 type II secretion system F family protein [Austwickia sp.]MBK9100105.1 type II secretion system F family protein [Austwickia sp.]
MTPLIVGGLLAVACWLAMTPSQTSRGRPTRVGRRRRYAARRQSPATAPVSELAEVAELLAMALTGGCGVTEAVELVGDLYPGVLGAHLRTVAAAARWGLEGAARWDAVPAEWAPVRNALALADEAGIPPAQALTTAAEDIRRREAHRIEVAAARFGAKAVLPLGLAFLPAFVLTTIVPVVFLLARDLLR